MQRDGLFPLDYTIKQMNDELTSIRVDAGISLVGNIGVVGARGRLGVVLHAEGVTASLTLFTMFDMIVVGVG